MHELLLLITAVLFYFMGRFSGREVEKLSDIKKNVQRLQKRQNSIPVGAVSLSTPESRKYSGSEREKIDQKARELLKSQGLV